MNNLFIPYEIALKLKDLGFNEPCIKYSNIVKIGDNKEEIQFGYICDIENGINFNKPNYQLPGDGAGSYVKCYNYTSIPLYQQVINWSREKHKLEVSLPAVASTKSFKWVSYIISIEKDNDLLKYTKNYKDYYECLNESIEEAIKLINV